MNTFTEPELSELLDFISGSGKFVLFGSGIHTYPNGDANNRRIFEACLELERRGLLGRWIDEQDHVYFVSTKKMEEYESVFGKPPPLRFGQTTDGER